MKRLRLISIYAALLAVSMPLLYADAAYSIVNSLRFTPSGTTNYLSKTLTTPTANRVWTFSAWVKRADFTGNNRYIFNGGGTTKDTLAFNTSEGITLWINNVAILVTSAVYRDPAAWMHIVLAVDTTQATASNRVKLYVNGSQVTAFSTASYPSQNSATTINSAAAHAIGAPTNISAATQELGGYLADVYFVDGQQLTPASFGQSDSSGYWHPKAYTGTYGTNGFHLEFTDSSALGTDTSGNTNTWTVNGITATDRMIDSPTNNFATGNPLAPLTGSTNYSAGNLLNTTNATSTFFMNAGKWYWEVTARAAGVIAGVVTRTGASDTTSVTNNATTGFRFDADAGTLDATTDGSSFSSVATGLTGGRYAFFSGSALFIFGAGGTTTLTYSNAGRGYFRYTPPSGYLALSTYNLPVPAVLNPKNYFDAQTYTGHGAPCSSGTLTGETCQIILTTGASFTVPLDWNNQANSIEVIGGGGGGGIGSALSFNTTQNVGGSGGGGGAYSASHNVTLTPGASVTYAIGAGGAAATAGGDTYFCNSSSNCASISGTSVVVGAKGGSGASTITPGTGGGSASGVGSITYSGGNGGVIVSQYIPGFPASDIPSRCGAGGGGAAGPYRDGASGGVGNLCVNGYGAGGGGADSISAGGTGSGSTAGSGGLGGNIFGTILNTGGGGGANGVAGGTGSAASGSGGGGGGGGGAGAAGGAGGAGMEWGSAGSGGGGGGAGGTNAVANGGAGGLYGGGGGGEGVTAGSLAGSPGSGAKGVIIITYTVRPYDPVYTNFSPDLVWIKNRDDASTDHALFDTSRGVYKFLPVNSGLLEGFDAGSVTAFLSHGFRLGSSTTANVNASGKDYISWLWKKSPVAGIDIVAYTGDDTSDRTINHSLGSAPDMVVVSAREAAGGPFVWLSSLSGATSYLLLSSSTVQSTTDTPWGTGAFTSSSFMVTNNATNNLNALNGTYVAYLFASTTGFSTFGSYTGNGNASGPFVYTGFKPRFLMIKRNVSTAGDWYIWDTARNTYNPVTAELFANTAAAEGTTADLDMLANGFKIRATTAGFNANGGVYSYAAFADVPFKYSAFGPAVEDTSSRVIRLRGGVRLLGGIRLY